ncbi:MAG: FecR domain-containing protein [Kiritimatiellae bacterium]|nr:FecR domain-containing protein [Kiritimatiellia bacterium]
MCERYTDEQILDYLLGNMGPGERRALDNHLPSCDSCRIALDELSPLARFSNVPEILPRPKLDAAVHELISAEVVKYAAGRAEPMPGHLGARPDRRRGGGRTRPLSAGPWGWRLTAAAAAVLLAFGLYLGREIGGLRPLAQDTASAETPVPCGAVVQQISGSVALLRAEAPRVPAQGEPLCYGDRLQTGPDRSRAVLAYADGTHFVVNRDTTVRLQPDPSGPAGQTPAGRCLSVHGGDIFAAVTRTQPPQPTVVFTPHARVSVRGTQFLVSVVPDSTRIDVSQGEVDVADRHSRDSLTLTAGYGALAGPGIELAAYRIEKTAAGTRPTRASDGLLVLYTFLEGQGQTVRDVSGAGDPLDLKIEDPKAAQWLPNGGLAVKAPTRVFSAGPADKIIDACQRSNELTVETWMQPLNLTQGREQKLDPTSRIVSLSFNCEERLFTFVQDGPDFNFRLRTSETTANAATPLRAPAGAIGTTLTHVAITRDAAGQLVLYVNGVQTARATLTGSFANWDHKHHLVLARELHPDRHWETFRPWLGTLHLVAVYHRALDAGQVARQYRAGLPLQSPTQRTASPHSQNRDAVF